jgi:hypothetical protein
VIETWLDYPIEPQLFKKPDGHGITTVLYRTAEERGKRATVRSDLSSIDFAGAAIGRHAAAAQPYFANG